MKTSLILPLLALAFAGCVSTTHFNLNDIKQPSAVKESDHVAVVAGADLASHRDEITVAGSVLWTFPTGEIAKQIFNGPAEAPWRIERLSSQLTLDHSDMMPLPVFSAKAHFSISCVLKGPDRQVPLSAVGTGETMVDDGSAIRAAVEHALIDIAKQASVVIAPVVANAR
jgi:hypothetical protein